MQVDIFTDGACSGNPGPGGWAAILVALGKEKPISGGTASSTNNRMELTAAIEALKCLKSSCQVNLYSDSAYLVNAFNQGWLVSWKRNGWKNSARQTVSNLDLWQELDRLSGIHQITWHKVKGHSDHEYNNRCDAMAVAEVNQLKGQLPKEKKDKV